MSQTLIMGGGGRSQARRQILPNDNDVLNNTIFSVITYRYKRRLPRGKEGNKEERATTTVMKTHQVNSYNIGARLSAPCSLMIVSRGSPNNREKQGMNKGMGSGGEQQT